MVIHSVIIHELKKAAGVVGAKVRYSNNVMNPTDERIVSLIEELNKRYKSRNTSYGVFDTENPTRFHDEFASYIKTLDDDWFIEFTKKTSRDLREKVEGIAPAKGGFLIFARYTDYRHFLGIFLVRDTEGMLFKRNTQVKVFDIKKAHHIDFEKMAMACRINLQAYKDKDGRYLSFINKKSDTMSRYFTSWISSTDIESEKQDTDYLYRMLNTIDVPADEQGNAQDKNSFLERVYKFIYNSPERRVNVRELSGTFYGDEDFLPSYVEENAIPINSEFKAHSTALKKFIQIHVKAGSLELRFSHHQYKKSVRFDENVPSQIIIDSQELVDKIKEQIEEYE